MPITIRQFFYRLISAGFIKNSVDDYKRLCSALANERGFENLPWVIELGHEK